ncbi:MAG: hypothetical protein ACFFBH_03090 [Promethearchaeota archaeon]
MKKKVLILPFSILIVLLCLPSARAYQYSDNINEGISAFFLTALNEGETIEISVTHSGSGNFTLFLFDQRPMDTYVNLDKTLNREIFTAAINYSLIENPYLYYNATESKIYYFQIILLDYGPDTYFIYCNKELTRYYLPIIPGYDSFFILASIIMITGLLVFKMKKSNIKI